MTHRCPDRVHPQGSLSKNPSNARGIPQKIHYSTSSSTLISPTDSGEEPFLNVLYEIRESEALPDSHALPARDRYRWYATSGPTI